MMTLMIVMVMGRWLQLDQLQLFFDAKYVDFRSIFCSALLKLFHYLYKLSEVASFSDSPPSLDLTELWLTVDGIDHLLGCRPLEGGLSLPCARSVVDR